MPMQQSGDSPLFRKIGQKIRAAHSEAANAPTEYGQMEPPAGIENGIAQLVEAKFDTVKPGKQNAGQYFFYAAGVIKEPKAHDGVPCEGMRTSIMEMLCDTPASQGRKTVEEHLKWVYNELRKLGINTAQMQAEDLESTVAALKESQPHFRFRTWKGQKQTTGPYAGREPRVNHQWNGFVEYQGDAGPGDAVEDATPEPAPAPAKAAPQKPPGKPPVKTAPPKAPEPEPEPQAEDTDWAALAAAADGGDVEAMAAIKAAALEAGAEESAVDDAANWGEVLGLAGLGEAAAEEGAEPEPEEEPAEEPWEPKVGETYKHQVIDPKTKKPVVDAKTKRPRKAVEHLVQAVDKKAQTVTLKDLGDGKTIRRGVSWDTLEDAAD